jgi:hypothetical protein
VVGGSWRKLQGLLQNLGIFMVFWFVWSGLGPNCKKFFETEGPAIIFSKRLGNAAQFTRITGASLQNQIE